MDVVASSIDELLEEKLRHVPDPDFLRFLAGFDEPFRVIDYLANLMVFYSSNHLDILRYLVLIGDTRIVPNTFGRVL